MFLFSKKDSYRYSLAEYKWEELPCKPIDDYSCACSLGDKVYLLSPSSRSIKLLHNPDTPVSSQEMHCQDIEVPGDVAIPFFRPTFAPLNSTKIMIAWGMEESWNEVGDIVTYDTTTCELKKEVSSRDSFSCSLNRSANVWENTIIAFV